MAGPSTPTTTTSDISRWRLRNSLIWIPQPDVLLGGRKIPGWDIRIAVAWTRTTTPYTRPAPQPYLDTPQVLRRLRLATYPTLWNLIAAGQIRPPDIWLDNHPGWDVQRDLRVRAEAASYGSEPR